jgi:hypothetical protein
MEEPARASPREQWHSKRHKDRENQLSEQKNRSKRLPESENGAKRAGKIREPVLVIENSKNKQ